MQVNPVKPTLKAPRTKRLKVKCDEPLSNFAFNFNLRRYKVAETKRVIHAEVRNLHVELLKQFHDMREEQLQMFEELRGQNAELAAEVESLRRHQQEYVRQ